jgi:DNA polymerase-3 subunit gamma/tau
MTQELYKRHRPRRLDKVVGNTETVEALRAMLLAKRVPHSILFSGPSGCGKTTLARILRSELGCHDLDFVEMNCSSFRGIDTVRDIMRTMHLSPAAGPCRVWILDEVHQLSRDGQHGALKMLEDTPSHVYFLLCTTDPQKLLPTIRNRCTDLPVRTLTQDEVGRLVRRVSKRAKITLSEEIRDLLVTTSEGSPRAALVALEKLRHVPPEAQADALVSHKEEQTEAIELCRALIKKQPWKRIAQILGGLKSDPERIRWAVLGYARSVLLRSKDPQAYLVLCAFESHFYDSKDAGLARACYEAIYGE